MLVSTKMQSRIRMRFVISYNREISRGAMHQWGWAIHLMLPNLNRPQAASTDSILIRCRLVFDFACFRSTAYDDVKWKHFPRYRAFTGPGEILTQRPVTWSFNVFFDLRLNQQLSKQWRDWWFETPSRSLWRHCNTMDNSNHLLGTHDELQFLLGRLPTSISMRIPKM